MLAGLSYLKLTGLAGRCDRLRGKYIGGYRKKQQE
jgi:hypothetical protein